MDHVRWLHRPALRDPVVLAAFSGWNDAGEGASGAVRWFADRWDARPFAEVDCEEFYDFTETRPHVRLSDGHQREVDWPAVTLSAATVPGTDVDVILLEGSEPQLKWRTFCGQITDVASACGARLALTLGALLAEVPHTRPCSVVGTAHEVAVIDELGLVRSTYEGPTGIIGVLHQSFATAGMRSASLWAAVPTYVPHASSPSATLALVERACTVLKVGAVTTDLEIAAAAYERQVSELVDADDDTAAYVRRLEEDADEPDPGEVDDGDEPVTGDLVEEVERYLRDRPGGT